MENKSSIYRYKYDQTLSSREGGKGSPGLPINSQEQLKYQQESAANKLLTYLRESLGVSQPEGQAYDVNIFTTRVIEGLEELENRIDRKRLANKIGDMRREETCSYREASGEKLDESRIHKMELEKNKNEAHLRGLEDALKLIDAYILGRQAEEQLEYTRPD